jgi:hypothetical protein
MSNYYLHPRVRTCETVCVLRACFRAHVNICSSTNINSKLCQWMNLVIVSLKNMSFEALYVFRVH